MARWALAGGIVCVWLPISAAAQSAQVVGRVDARQAGSLPTTAILEVTLLDASRVQATPPVLAVARLEAAELPAPFELRYAANRIDTRRRYAVTARVVDGPVVLFTYAQPVPVITQGHGNRADVMLVRVTATPELPSPSERRVQPSAPSADAPLAPRTPAPVLAGYPLSFSGTLSCAGCPDQHYQLALFEDDVFALRVMGAAGSEPTGAVGSWVLSSDRRALVLDPAAGAAHVFEIRDRLTLRAAPGDPADPAERRGELHRTSTFQPFDMRLAMTGVAENTAAGAAFIECSTGRRFAWSAASADADPAGALVAPGSPALVTLTGRLVFEVPRVPGAPAASRLTVDHVDTALPGASCPPRFAAAPLEQTNWTLAADDRRADSPDPTAATLTFRPDPHSFSATAGCLRVTGSYDRAGDALRLIPAGAISACATGAGGAARFGDLLRATRGYVISGRTLHLLDASRHPIARFTAGN
jgi:uncharacterized lipoprotein YbaY/heat shock protein HslJ